MTELAEWFLYLLPLNIAALYLLMALSKYVRAITPPSYIIESDGIKVNAMSAADAQDAFAAAMRIREKYEA